MPMLLARRVQELRFLWWTACSTGTVGRSTNAGFRNFCNCRSGGYNEQRSYNGLWHWGALMVPAVVGHDVYENTAFAEGFSNQSNSDSSPNSASISGLYRVEDGSVISNIHTSKWRVFTDKGSDLFIQGKLEEAEKYFISALEEAKEGFGMQDPHVASACNNLAELYRVKKAFDKAEPLYLEAIRILEESFGNEDIRVGSALHNLGQFYLVQRKAEAAYSFYERALKIKRRVLGHGSPDYANTLYHLGVATHMMGDVKDAAAIIQSSVSIEEEANDVDHGACIRRLRYLAKVYLKSHLLDEAEGVQRKILHLAELSRGWNSLQTVFSAENLAMTLQLLGKFREAEELLERCLVARKVLFHANHVQVAANMLSLAHVALLNLKHPKNITELGQVKYNLEHSVRIALDACNRYLANADVKSGGVSDSCMQDARVALIVLIKSLHLLELMGNVTAKSEECMEGPSGTVGVSGKCVAYFRQLGYQGSTVSSPKMKTDYSQCLEEFLTLVTESMSPAKHTEVVAAAIQDLQAAIKDAQAQLSSSRQATPQSRRNFNI